MFMSKVIKGVQAAVCSCYLKYSAPRLRLIPVSGTCIVPFTITTLCCSTLHADRVSQPITNSHEASSTLFTQTQK